MDGGGTTGLAAVHRRARDMTAPAPAVRMTGITKSFDGVRVLNGVDLEIARGEIHALVGGNGAGKSTLMKILEGVYSLDEGTIEVGGEPVRFHSSEDARRAGIAMIFQEFSLVPALTVAQNVFLNREASGRGGFIDDREMERRTREVLATMEVDIDPRRSVDDLPTATRQLTEIAKALSQEARVLIMDEPTSSLGRSETVLLFGLVRRLRERGIAIVYISHRMEEVLEIADTITVLRDGRRVLSTPTSAITLKGVIDAIVGREHEQAAEWQGHESGSTGEVLLEVRGLRSGSKLRGVDLVLRQGEIVGLAGLMGSGRSELARAIFGIDRIAAGEVLLRGRPVTLSRPQDAIDARIALIPEDRHVQGLVLDHTVRENALLPLLGRLSRGGIIDDAAGDRVVDSYVDSLAIKTRSMDTPVRLLSGGNQQKVVIAKWLATEPAVLLMDEPTAGVDIGTKYEIVAMIREFAAAGNAVLFISSELPELLAACDRVLVMRDGRVERGLGRSEIRSEEDLHHAIQGVH
jgi:ribose transport system ATP-binding protein